MFPALVRVTLGLLLHASCTCLQTEAATLRIRQNVRTLPNIDAKEVQEQMQLVLCKYAHAQAEMRQEAIRMVLDYKPRQDIDSMRALEQRIQTAKKCAVVSSSGVHLKHSYGPTIDAADLILRFNDAPVGGRWQEYVGSRDDVRIMNRKSFESMLKRIPPSEAEVIYLLNRHQKGDPVTEVMVDGYSKHYPFLHFSFSNETLLMSTGRNLLLELYPDFRKRLSSRDLPTTGFYGVMLMMTICDEVHAFGFPETAGGLESPFHYYGPLAAGSANTNEESVHSLFAPHEKLLYADMALNADVNETDVAVLPGFQSLQCA
mmetsp:Transcript_22587/g.41597  ORF Transcript_22587/g.41597 Transcript_22587/m.41597 type:complete len:317 (+) Transcript_22587:114-1064(+)